MKTIITWIVILLRGFLRVIWWSYTRGRGWWWPLLSLSWPHGTRIACTEPSGHSSSSTGLRLSCHSTGLQTFASVTIHKLLNLLIEFFLRPDDGSGSACAYLADWTGVLTNTNFTCVDTVPLQAVLLRGRGWGERLGVEKEGWCFGAQSSTKNWKITSGLKTYVNPSPSYSAKESSNRKILQNPQN